MQLWDFGAGMPETAVIDLADGQLKKQGGDAEIPTFSAYLR
jgi:hypothetical protein